VQQQRRGRPKQARRAQFLSKRANLFSISERAIVADLMLSASLASGKARANREMVGIIGVANLLIEQRLRHFG
jgi:hypothetical protein